MASINEKNLAKGDKKKFQVILIGYDDDEEANAGYLKKGLNFPALKIESRKALADFVNMGYSGFMPDLVLLKPDGTVVEMEDDEVFKKLEKLAGE